MKIKKLLVMALLAAATATTFSGCGGGEENEGNGYISAKKFANGGYVIRTQNTRSLEIAPEQKITGGSSGNVVTIPGEDIGDPAIAYTVSERVRCSGTIGAVGGSSYSAEFDYAVTTEDIGVIQVTITSSQTTDDSFLIAALGFGVDNLDSSSNSNSSSSSGSTYDRATVSHIEDMTLQLVLNFATSYMTVITSGAGYVVTYYNADGTVQGEHPCSDPIRVQTVPLPYYVQTR